MWRISTEFLVQMEPFDRIWRDGICANENCSDNLCFVCANAEILIDSLDINKMKIEIFADFVHRLHRYAEWIVLIHGNVNARLYVHTHTLTLLHELAQ